MSRFCLTVVVLLAMGWRPQPAPQDVPALFNGQDFSGWNGMPPLNPAELAAMSEDDRKAQIEKWTTESVTPAGKLRHLAPTLQLSETMPYWARPTVPLGYHQPVWPARP